MRERIPHDYLVVLGGLAVIAGLLLPIYRLAGIAVLILWAVSTVAFFWKYR
jgi:hypothetical protein